MNLIETKHKDKIPKEFSYSIGSETVSEAFRDFKHYDVLELRFHYRGQYWASKFTNTLKEKGEILIFRLEYSNRRPGFSAGKSLFEMGYYGEHWEITVYAVPRGLKNKVKSIFLNYILIEALKRSKEWSNQNLPTYQNFEIYLDLKTEQHRTRERVKR
jgi:hypothetical protein